MDDRKRYAVLRKSASRGRDNRGYVASELRRIGKAIGKSFEEIEGDIRKDGGRDPLEAETGRGGGQVRDFTMGPWVNVRIRRQVHLVVKAAAKSRGLTISRYLAQLHKPWEELKEK